MDLIDDPQPGENAHEYTVTEISGAVKRVIEGEFGRVRVKGEVGRVFVARSGHLYFDIKDDRNVLASVTWKGQVAGLTAKPEEGMEVVATGRLTTFGSQSKYQLTVDDLRPAGVGALMAMLEKRKAALQAEGLFAAERKQPLPYLPDVIGVVTSPSGAVIRDILHRLRERFPRKVLVWPVAVQGRDAAPQVARAIDGFNALTIGGPIPRPDLIIVARGGGSIEDLWGFNEEVVARAAANSTIPLISAVGHETDTTLIDYVSDIRAPTPTAAAELAVPVRIELVAALDAHGARMTRGLKSAITQRRQRVRDLARALPRPETLSAPARQRLDNAEARLEASLRMLVAQRRGQLVAASASLRPRVLTQLVTQHRQRVEDRAARLPVAFGRLFDRQKDRLAHGQARLVRAAPMREVAVAQGVLDRTSQRLGAAMAVCSEKARARLDGLERLHLSLGYRATLARGYAIVRSDQTIIATKTAAAKASHLTIEFQDGMLDQAAPRRAKSKAAKKPDQGSLF